MADLNNMRNRYASKDKTSHKEEMRSRIESDATDRLKIQKCLETCINPLDASNHPNELVNIHSGFIAVESVNVDEAVSVGKEQLRKFEGKWPGGFYAPIRKEIKTMIVNKRGVKMQEIEVYNTEIISAEKLKLCKVLKYELSPIPMSLFEDAGEMRVSKDKAKLKKALQVVSSNKIYCNVDAVVIDGSALLWTAHWPTKGTVEDLAKAVMNIVSKFLQQSDVYLVFAIVILITV